MPAAMRTGARTMRERVAAKGPCGGQPLAWGRGEGGGGYHFGRRLDRVATQRVAGHLDACADEHAEEEPRTILDDSQVKGVEEDETVEDTPENGKGEGRRVHPHHFGFVGHFGYGCWGIRR